MTDGVLFSISTDLEFRGRELKALKPDKNGVYKGLPLSVIGMKSRNGIVYERDSVMDCLTDPKSRFVQNLKSGDLEGEWGHPFLDPTDPKKMVGRLLFLDRKNVSHHFTKIYAKEDKDSGYVIIYGDVKPSGPMGEYLEKNLQDPTRNASFSLRSATVVTRKEAGVTYKRMLAMFTFDAVDGPGYVEASKRFQDVAGMEGLSVAMADGKSNIDVNVSKEEFLKATASLDAAGIESNIVDQRVLDAFGCDEVIVRERVLHRVRGGFADAHGVKASIFDTMFGS